MSQTVAELENKSAELLLWLQNAASDAADRDTPATTLEALNSVRACELAYRATRDEIEQLNSCNRGRNGAIQGDAGYAPLQDAPA